jgi:hypothetical protein
VSASGWESCEYPVVVAHAESECGEPAVIEVEGLGTIRYLCARHHSEAQGMNDYLSVSL